MTRFEGDYVLIAASQLVYRKRQVKGVEVSRIELLVWAVDALTKSPQDQSLDTGESGGQP